MYSLVCRSWLKSYRDVFHKILLLLHGSRGAGSIIHFFEKGVPGLPYDSCQQNAVGADIRPRPPFFRQGGVFCRCGMG